MISQQNDAGRNLSHPNETNDCTVVALANAAGISYGKAHELAAQFGRRNRHGMKKDAIKRMLCNLDISGLATTRQLPVTEPVHVSRKVGGYFSYRTRGRRVGTSVASFLHTLPKYGRFYIGSTSHAFAYVDGVVVDNLQRPKSRAIMLFCYEIIPAVKVEEEKPVNANPCLQPAPQISQEQINELWERLNKLEAK
jgi:hypothetical protein